MAGRAAGLDGSPATPLYSSQPQRDTKPIRDGSDRAEDVLSTGIARAPCYGRSMPMGPALSSPHRVDRLHDARWSPERAGSVIFRRDEGGSRCRPSSLIPSRPPEISTFSSLGIGNQDSRNRGSGDETVNLQTVPYMPPYLVNPSVYTAAVTNRR